MAQDTMTLVRRIVGNLVMEGIPEEIPSELTDKLLQYQNTRGAAFKHWGLKDQGMLITTRFSEVSQIHSVEEPKGVRRQLTFFKEHVRGANLCPNPEVPVFIFQKDVGGSENYQLFTFNLEDGSHKMLTDGVEPHSFGKWSKKEDAFVFAKRKGTISEIYRMHLQDELKDAQLLISLKGAWWIRDWSPDDRYLLLGEFRSISESYCHLLDVETGKLQAVNLQSFPISYTAAIFDQTGDSLFVVMNQDQEFLKLFYYDLSTKEVQLLTQNIEWDIEEIELSKDGKTLAFTANENGHWVLYLMNTKTFEYRRVENVPVGLVYGLSFHEDNNQLAMTINSSKSPSDVYVYDIANDECIRWTYAEVGGLNTNTFIEPEAIAYPTFDTINGQKRKIPAYVYKPNVQKKHPVLIHIHGGPESQFVPHFSPSFQYMLQELNIAVIAPNVRGSSGYGKNYLSLDNGYLREDSVKDIGALLEWIIAQDDLDEERVVVSGGSYGGYMVLASMIHYGDKIKAGIDRVGISNFVTFLTNTKEYRRDLRRAEYGDERDPDMRAFLESISPTSQADKLKKPLFIIQGANDPRVPLSEAEQILERVKENGTPVWYLMAKDEGHGFHKKSNMDYALASSMLFLEKFLLDKS